MDESQAKRFKALEKLTGGAAVVPHTVAHDSDSADAFLQQSIEKGHEGIMAKLPTAPYAAGARGRSWLKVKQANTLDLVILAAEWGNGRRRGWLSNLHLGARDTEKGGFAMRFHKLISTSVAALAFAVCIFAIAAYMLISSPALG